MPKLIVESRMEGMSTSPTYFSMIEIMERHRQILVVPSLAAL
jgi:hypothetical protein